jgi:hypothetical protein
LSLPSFSLANRQTAVHFPNYIGTRLGVGYGTSGPTTTGATTDLFWRQAPLLGLWFDSPLLATILELPAAFLSSGTHPCDSITESARTTEELDTGAAKRGRLKRPTLLSSIKASTIADSRSSFLNFKFPASPPWNRTRLGAGYGTSGPTTAGATTDLFWRQAPLPFQERCAPLKSSLSFKSIS